MRSIRQHRLAMIAKGAMIAPCLYVAEGVAPEVRVNGDSGTSSIYSLEAAEAMGVIIAERLATGGYPLRIWIFSPKVEIYLRPASSN
jgi:hypothetical protein